MSARENSRRCLTAGFLHALLLATVGILATAPARGQVATLDTLIASGPSAEKINIVVFSEAYPESQLGKFRSQALAAVQYFLNTEPMVSYASSFNAYAVSVPSADSGADHPLQSLYRKTYFNSTYDTYGIERLLTIDAVGYARLDSLSMVLMPDYDIRIVLVNDGEYGGSGGSVAVASLHPSSAEIMVHELGHSFGGLADEYSDPYPGWVPREYPNATQATDRSSVTWDQWILSSTPLPTPLMAQYGPSVGLFEGAQYQATGWYRPKSDCKMRHLGVPFCEVCQQALVDRIASLTSVPRLPAPAPVEPADYTTDVRPDTAVFRWNGDEGTTGARLQIARDSLFTDLALDTLEAGSRCIVTHLGSGARYFWRVREIKPGMLGEYSAPRRFFTGATLPVVLASLVCGPVGPQTVQLRWETLSEVNNYGFEVQRSLQPASGFASVSPLIPGHGTTIEPHQYFYIDSTAGAARWFYRLKEIDLDGTEHFTETVQASALSAATEFLAERTALMQNYPNPFNPKTEVRYQVSVDSNVDLTVYDILGRRVATLVNEIKRPGQYEVEFDAASLASGIYFYRLTVRPLGSTMGRDSRSGDGHVVETRKMILAK